MPKFLEVSDTSAARTALGVNAETVVNIVDYGGVGNGTADDSDAFQACIAALPKGGTIQVPDGQWTYSEDLILPRGTTLRGVGRNSATTYWADAPQLKPLDADARIFVDDYCTVENLVVNGNALGKWAFQTGNLDSTNINWVANSVTFNNVVVWNFTETAFVCEGLQNSLFIKCSVLGTPVGWRMCHGAANIELLACNWRITSADEDARAILIKKDLTDTRFMAAAKYQADPGATISPVATGLGAQYVRVWGGIFEEGPCDYLVEVLDGFTAYYPIYFANCLFSGATDMLSVIHLGTDTGKLQLTLSDVTLGGGGASAKAVIAESGQVVYRNVNVQSMEKNLPAATQVSGTASVCYDDMSSMLIESDFSTGISAGHFNGDDWTGVGVGGDLSWDSTAKRLNMVCPSANAGVGVKFRLSTTYAAQYDTVTARFRIVDATGPMYLRAWQSSGGNRLLGTFGNGEHEITIELLGTEIGFQFNGGYGSVTADLDYFYAYHGGATSGAYAPALMNWSGLLKDAWGEPWLEVVHQDDAVNYFQIANRAAGNPPRLVAVGDDTNINVEITPKGTGRLRVGNVVVPTVSSTDTLTGKTLTNPKITSGNAPATAGATGSAGQIEWDADYIYICTATNTWKRAAIATW